MSNILYIPDLNPIPFVDTTATVLPQYNSRHFEDNFFEDTQSVFEHKTTYAQKWQRNDSIFLQFTSNYAPIQVDVINIYGNSVLTVSANQVRVNKYLTDYYIYEASIALSSLTVGYYYLKVTAGDRILKSEPIQIAEKIENSIIFEYSNSHYHGGVVFETGIKFSFRVEGVTGLITPASKEVNYEDQKLNQTVLSSKTYYTQKLEIGFISGVPDWVVQKINDIFSCNTVFIDGKEFCKAGDAKFEFKGEERFRKRSISVDIRPGINRGSKIFSSTISPSKRLIVVHNISGKVFGDTANQAGSNLISITDVE